MVLSSFCCLRLRRLNYFRAGSISSLGRSHGVASTICMLGLCPRDQSLAPCSGAEQCACRTPLHRACSGLVGVTWREHSQRRVGQQLGPFSLASKVGAPRLPHHRAPLVAAAPSRWTVDEVNRGSRCHEAVLDAYQVRRFFASAFRGGRLLVLGPDACARGSCQSDCTGFVF